jgi:hypothetical protein
MLKRRDECNSSEATISPFMRLHMVHSSGCKTYQRFHARVKVISISYTIESCKQFMISQTGGISDHYKVILSLSLISSSYNECHYSSAGFTPMDYSLILVPA